MKVMLIHSSGFVTTYFGPFDGKSEADRWAKDAELTNYSLVIMMSPWTGEAIKPRAL